MELIRVFPEGTVLTIDAVRSVYIGARLSNKINSLRENLYTVIAIQYFEPKPLDGKKCIKCLLRHRLNVFPTAKNAGMIF